jgi:predicted aldo/keto reductase-like oxidoreductase
MRKVRLGKSDLMVTQVGFGGIPIQRLTEAEAVKVVQHCLDQGINWLDTARVYTTSEERIGKAVGGRRDGLVLATKSVARDRAGFLADVDLSLQRLGVEYIDLYQLHNVAKEEDYERVLAPGGALEGARDAQKAGKIHHIGITSHSLDMAKRAVQSHLFETIMFPLNFVAREPGEELYPLAVEHDVGFIVMKPLGGGLLGDARLAFKYLSQFPRTVPIPGIEKMEEIDEILQILKEPPHLSEVEKAKIEKIREDLGGRFCRRCQYCEPCPQGIATSWLMVAESFWKRSPLDRFVGAFEEAVEKAATDCDKCGQCEERCPYGLPIRDMLDESIALYRRERTRYDETVASA